VCAAVVMSQFSRGVWCLMDDEALVTDREDMNTIRLLTNFHLKWECDELCHFFLKMWWWSLPW